MPNDIVSYWNELKTAVDTKEPIFKWPCFNPNLNRIPTLERFIEEIGDVLATVQYSNYKDAYSEYERSIRKAFSCLFLVRCALISRLCDDWELIIRDKFFEGIGNIYFDRSTDWRLCIRNAEKALRRPPLIQNNLDIGDTSTKPRRYCARVLVEAGIPLRALSQNNGVVFGLRNICKLYTSTLNEIAYENYIKKFMLSGNFEEAMGQDLWLPGGLAGCRNFFSIGLGLIEDTLQGLTEGNSIKSLLQSYGFTNPSDSAISEIFGIRSNSYERRSLSIKRFLHWEDEQFSTQVYIKYKPSSKSANTEQLQLKIAGNEIKNWTYASNGVLNGNSDYDYYSDRVFDSATLVREGNSSTSEKEVLSEVDLNSPIFFKRSLDPDSNGDFEWSSSSSFRQTDFPLCIIFPEGYVEEHALNLSNVEIKKFDIESYSDSFLVYKFESEQQLNEAGLSATSSKLVLRPPQQQFAITFEGRHFPNNRVSTEYPYPPIRCINAEILSRKNFQDRWRTVTSDTCDDRFHLAYYKLDSDTEKDPGTRLLILPRDFSYRFKKNRDKTTGIKFYYKDEDGETHSLDNVTVYIDGKENPNSTDWENLQHSSIIRCVIENSANEKISLTIPSPAVGISWVIDEQKSVCASTYKDLRINCVQNANAGKFEILYNIKLVDRDQVLLEFRESSTRIEPKEEIHVEAPPPFVSKLFSATNSLSAQIKISAQITRNGVPESSPDSHTEELVITRFDESEYNGRFFCVGLLNQEVLEPDVEPTEDQKKRELWMKIPAFFSSDGSERKWNKRNRIGLTNYSISDTSHLNAFQKLLLGNDVDFALKLVKNYFNSNCHNLDSDVIKIIQRSFDICVNYDIPICNLWVLQATIQDDRIFVQIPDISKYKHLLNENTYLCSFDWQLIRPSSLKFVKDIGIKKQIEQICSTVEDLDNETTASDYDDLYDIEQEFIPPQPIVDDDDDSLKLWYSEEITEEFNHDLSYRLTKTDLLLFFIVKYIVYGKDDHYNKLYKWALLCLKFLKTKNVHIVNTKLHDFRKRIASAYKHNLYRAGFNSIVWDEWKAGAFRATRVNEYSEDPFKQGQEAAKIRFRERFWFESLKKIFANAYNFSLYGFHFPSELNSQNLPSGKDFLQQAEAKLNELKQKFEQYKFYYQQGWESLGDNEAVQHYVYIPFLTVTDINKDFDEKARNIGEVVHKWLKNWAPKVDNFSVGTELKEYLKNLTPLLFLDLLIENQERANKLNKYLDVIPKTLGGLINNIHPTPNNLDDCINNLSGDSEKNLLKMLHNGFGIWRQEYMNKWPTDNKIFRPTRYQDFVEEAQELTGQAQNKQDRDIEDKAEDAYETAASLNIEAYVQKAKIKFVDGRNNINALKTEMGIRKAERTGFRSIDFNGRLKTYYYSGTSALKDSLYAYKTASRLEQNEAYFPYYQEICSLRKDIKILDTFNSVRTFNLTNDVRQHIRRDSSIFEKWLNENNEWVYLRKAALASIPQAIPEWEKIEAAHTKKIVDPRDNKEYTAICIDGVWWLAENLRYSTLGAICLDGQYYYDQQSAQDAVIEGWRLPSKKDFENLNKWSTKHSIQKNPGGVSLKSQEWKPNEAIRRILGGTDDFGFNAKPSGMMIVGLDKILRKDEAFYWTSSVINENSAYCACLSSSDNELDITSMSKDYCLALRLVCDHLPDSKSSLDDEDIN